MKMLSSKILQIISIILIICIVVVIIMIYKNSLHVIPIKFFIPGNLNNIGCLSAYVLDNTLGNEYSFDNGNTWQKNNYGVVYGKTTILVRNKDKKIVYKKNISDKGFVQNAPIIKMNFDQNVNNKSDSELLKGVSASINGQNITSTIKTNVLKEEKNELIVSYLVHNDINRCYVVRKIKVNESSNNTSNVINESNEVVSDKWIWPTNKPYQISSYYGWRNKKFHSGVDIYGPKRGSSIYAARAGIVTNIDSNSSSGYYVIIKHDNGYYTRYAHMQNTKGNDKLGLYNSANKYVFVGLRVKAHDVIGEMGSSGNSTGVHLHFEIWNGKPFASKSFNPLSFYK